LRRGSRRGSLIARAVLYCRVSTKDQVENLSLPTQEKACREWAARAGAEVAEVFVDRGESAKTADRPAFQAAIARCRAGGIDFFVVYSLSRFARSIADHAIIGARLKAYGVTLRSVTEPIDDTATGRLMETMIAGFAQFDNDARADRTRAGMRAALERGRWAHRPPLGYLTGMIPDPDRAPLIRRGFELAASWPGSAEALRREVGRLGLTARSGRPVPRNTFANLLRAPVYAGILRAPGFEGRASFEPLVDEETFLRAQAGLAGRLRPALAAARVRESPDFPLRGLLVCGVCGRRLTSYFVRKPSGLRFGYYRCRCDAVSVPSGKLEAAFVDLLDRAGLAEGVLEELKAAILEEWKAASHGAVEARERRDRAVAAARAKKSRLLDAYLAQAVDRAAYDAKLAEIEDEIAAASAAMIGAHVDEAELTGALAFAEVVLRRPGRAWLELDPAGRRGFVKLAFEAPPAVLPGGTLTNPRFSCLFNGLRAAAPPEPGEVALPDVPANPLGALISLYKAAGSSIPVPAPFPG